MSSSLKSILGVDLRVTSVKVVELDKSKDGFFISGWGLDDIPYNLINQHPQKEDAQAEALKRIIQEKHLLAKEAVVVASGKEAFVKVYSVPGVNQAEIAEALKWKLAEEVPFSIDDALIDYYPLEALSTDSPEKYYAVGCLSKKSFEQFDYILTKAGLKLKAVRIIPDSLAKVFQTQLLEAKGKIVSLIYMGRRTTNISIYKDNELDFNRELDIGGENITLAMSGVLVASEGKVEIDPDRAEKIKVEHGIPIDAENFPQLEEIPINQLQAMVRPALERVQDEIMRTFEYYKSISGEGAVDKIILTGGSAGTHNLAQFLSDGLGITIEASVAVTERNYDAQAADNKDLPKRFLQLSAAIGAAMLDEEKINLVPEEIKDPRKILIQKYTQPQYVVGAFVIFIGLIYAIMNFWLMSLQSNLDSIEKKLKGYQPMIKGLAELQRRVAVAESRQVVITRNTKARTKMPKFFQEISQLIPQSVYISSLKLTPKTLHMWGTTLEKGNTAENVLSKFAANLSESKHFSEVKLVQAIKNSNYNVDAFDFEITANINLD